jgi:AcrR family transcriptional regulator
MVSKKSDSRDGRGRPQIRSDEETLRVIIEAARQEFLAHGYADTGMAAVAQKAGISTKTLYRLVPNKAELFKAVVSERIGRFMLEIDDLAVGALDLPVALERILVAYGNLTLDQEVIAINRLVLGEGERFPEIAKTFYEGAVRPAGEAIADWLARQRKRGLIEIDSPIAAAGMLRGMMTMEPQRAAMLGQRKAPSVKEITARAETCARLFLQGCSSAGRPARQPA